MTARYRHSDEARYGDVGRRISRKNETLRGVYPSAVGELRMTFLECERERRKVGARDVVPLLRYSTVTLFARFRG